MDYKSNKKSIIAITSMLSITTIGLIFVLVNSVKSKGNVLLSVINYAVDCCTLYFNKFLGFILIEKAALAYAGVAFLIFGFVDGIYNMFYGIKKMKILKTKLMIKEKFILKNPYPINIFDGGNLKTAFTAGLFKPEIFISSGLWNSLDDNERKSVLAHELHHAMEKDPLRIVLLNFISDTFFFIPIIKWLNKKYEESMEKSADDEVKKGGLNELSLASALLKASKDGGMLLPVASFASIDTKSLTESRVVRLIDPKRDSRLRIPKRVFTVTAIIYLVLLFSAWTIPEGVLKTKSGNCLHSDKKMSCSSNMSVEECRKHCLGEVKK